MKAVKIIATVLVCALCLAILALCGSWIFRASKAPAQPPRLDAAQELFPAPEPETEPEPELPQPQTAQVPLTPAEKAAEYLAAMTMEEKLWQLFFLTPDDLTGFPGATLAGEATQAALEERPVGGLCYFAQNLLDAQQITALLHGTQSFAKTPLFLATDEEGGRVMRLGSNDNSGVAPMKSAAQYGAGDVLELRKDADLLAQQMQALGFNMNFAPVADVLIDKENSEIGDRAYSDIASVCGIMSATMADVLQNRGIIACLKHFPGHGSADANSHEGKAISTRTPEQLAAEEFLSFRAGIEKGVKFVMMSHLTNEEISPDPSSLSAPTVQMLRDLGFDGIVITDSLKMTAITGYYTAGDAALKAIQAGCDMLLMPNSAELAYDALAGAILDGTLSAERIDESVLRILTTKYEMGIME